MKLLMVRLRALTASFRIPFALSGVQISLSVPPYSTLLGLISCCAGRNIGGTDTDLGFEFTSQAKTFDLERFNRWQFKAKKNSPNPKGPAVRKREFLINPELTIYLSNLDLEADFKHPKGIITLGRSQDVAWIEEIQKIDVEKVKAGEIGGTLIPFELCQNTPPNGFLIRICDELETDSLKMLRFAKNNNLYLATDTQVGHLTPISLSERLFRSSNFATSSKCIYLHHFN